MDIYPEEMAFIYQVDNKYYKQAYKMTGGKPFPDGDRVEVARRTVWEKVQEAISKREKQPLPVKESFDFEGQGMTKKVKLDLIPVREAVFDDEKGDLTITFIREGANLNDTKYYTKNAVKEAVESVGTPESRTQGKGRIIHQYLNHIDGMGGMSGNKDLTRLVSGLTEAWTDESSGVAVGMGKVHLIDPQWKKVMADPVAREMVAFSVEGVGKGRIGKVLNAASQAKAKPNKSYQIIEGFASLDTVDWVPIAGLEGKVVSLVRESFNTQERKATMKCSHCQADIAEGAKFCPICGEPQGTIGVREALDKSSKQVADLQAKIEAQEKKETHLLRVREAGTLIEAEIAKVGLPEDHAGRVKALFADRECPTEDAGKASFLTAVTEAVKQEHEFAKRLAPAPRVHGSGGTDKGTSMADGLAEDLFVQIKEAGEFHFETKTKEEDGDKKDHVFIPKLGHSMLWFFEKVRESGNAGDFANFLANVASRIVIDSFNNGMGNNQDFLKICKIVETPNFKAVDLPLLGQSETLDRIYRSQEYKDSKVSDQKTTIQVNTYGKLFSMDRESVINDDTNTLFGLAARRGMGAARTLAQFMQTTLLEGNGNAFDAVAFFHAATHGNLWTSGYTLTQANVEKLCGLMRLVNDTDGNRVGVRPRYLVHSPSLDSEARRICYSPQLSYQTSGTGYMQSDNPTAGMLEPVCLDFLTEHATPLSSSWYLWADPQEFVGVMLAFLRGGKQPTILRNAESEIVVGGARDPYDIPFDRLTFKVRWDFGGQLVEPWAIFKNTV